jgi:hypothetical protein
VADVCRHSGARRFFSPEGCAIAGAEAADLIEKGLAAAFGAQDITPLRLELTRRQGIPIDPAFPQT